MSGAATLPPILDTMMGALLSLFPSSMLNNPQVSNALVVGLVAAALSALIGYFVVLRGLSFAGHAVTDIGFAGGAGAILFGLNSFWGLLAFCLLAALGIDLLGARARERDVATGIILALALGLGSLFLSIGTRFINERFTLLFGSIFEADPSGTSALVAIGVGCVAVLAALYRPLVLASVAPDVAAARGVPVRLVGLLFIATMAIAVAEAAQVLGVLLSTALLIGPAASAGFLSARPWLVLVLGVVLGCAETVIGIVLAYDSSSWSPSGKGWPVSFFITGLALLVYLLTRFLRPVARRPVLRSHEVMA